MTDLATPCGRLVSDAPPESPEWFAARRGAITATDLPKILGLSRYGNATTVWADKLALLPPDETSEAARWGQLLEPVIADRWSAAHGTPVRLIGVLQHGEYPMFRASLDRIVEVCPDGDGPCGLEIKNRAGWKSAEWDEDVPDDILAQVTFQMIVAGFRHQHLAVLFGGNQLRSFRIDFDEAVAQLCIDEALRVWRAVEDKEPPEDAPSPLLGKVLDRLYPTREGTVEIPAQRLSDLLADYHGAAETLREANAAVGEAKAAKKTAEAALVAALRGGAEAARWPSTTPGELGPVAYSVKTVTIAAREQPGYEYRTVRVAR